MAAAETPAYPGKGIFRVKMLPECLRTLEWNRFGYRGMGVGLKLGLLGRLLFLRRLVFLSRLVMTTRIRKNKCLKKTDYASQDYKMALEN